MPTGNDPTGRIARNLFTLQRIGNTITAETEPLWQELFDQIVADLMRIDPTAPGPERWKRYRTDKFIAEVTERLSEATSDWSREVRGFLAQTGRQQGKFAEATLVFSLGDFGDRIRPTPITQGRVRAILNTEPFHGRPLAEWADSLERSTRDAIVQQVRLGMVQEETIPQLARRIRGEQAGFIRQDPGTGQFVPRGTAGAIVRPRYVGGVLSTSNRNAEAIVRTAVNHVSNTALLETYRENAQVLTGLEFSATLDDRTCFVAGTGVLTPTGERPIETLRPGDMVIGGSRKPRRVVATKKVRKTDMARVRLSNGREAVCTSDHPWLTADGVWTEAKDLKPYQHMAYDANMPYISWHENVSGVPSQIQAPAPEGEQVLRHGVLPRGAETRRLQGAAPDDRAVRRLREAAPTHQQQKAGRIPGGQPVLLPRLLPKEAHQETPMGVRRLREGGDAGRMGCEAPEVLLARLPSSAQATGPEGMPDVWGFVHPDPNSPEWRRGLQERSDHVFRGMLLPLGAGGRREEAEDWRGVQGRETPELVGWADIPVPRLAGAELAHDPNEGAEAGRPRVPGVWGDSGGQWSGSVGSPHRAVPQLRFHTESQPYGEPDDPMSAVPQDGRVAGSCTSNVDPAVSAVRVVSVELFNKPTTVYDIQVERDYSFVVGGVVVHNSMICMSLDGQVWPLESAEIRQPPLHVNCRSVLIPAVDWEGLGMTQPDGPGRVARDLSDVDPDDLGRRVSARRRTGDLGKSTPVPSSVRYTQWLRDQRNDVQNHILGPGRARLFREGKLDLRQLVTGDGRVVPLEVLERSAA
jgi:hypothetical protein